MLDITVLNLFVIRKIMLLFRIVELGIVGGIVAGKDLSKVARIVGNIAVLKRKLLRERRVRFKFSSFKGVRLTILTSKGYTGQEYFMKLQ